MEVLTRLRGRPAGAFAPFVLAAALFGLITAGVLVAGWPGAGWLARADASVLSHITAVRGPVLTPMARTATELGTGPVVYGVLVACGLLAWRITGRLAPSIAAVLVLAAGQVARTGINHLVGRPRPPRELWLVHPAGFAFPSGHSATATIGYGLAALLLARAAPAPAARRAAAGLAALVAVCVGLSRCYLGVHWPSDVLGGWMFGLAWLALAWAGADRYRRAP